MNKCPWPWLSAMLLTSACQTIKHVPVPCNEPLPPKALAESATRQTDLIQRTENSFQKFEQSLEKAKLD